MIDIPHQPHWLITEEGDYMLLHDSYSSESHQHGLDAMHVHYLLMFLDALLIIKYEKFYDSVYAITIKQRN